MLILIDTGTDPTPEDVEADLSLIADVAEQGIESVWFGKKLLLRGMLRNGTRLAVGMSLTECAALYGLFHADRTVRAWSDVMAARAALDDDAPLAAGER